MAALVLMRAGVFDDAFPERLDCALCDEDEQRRAWHPRPGPSRRERLGCGKPPVGRDGRPIDLLALCENEDLDVAEMQDIYEQANLGYVVESLGHPWDRCPRSYTRPDLTSPVAIREGVAALRAKAYLEDGALSYHSLTASRARLLETGRRVQQTLERKRMEAKRDA